MISGEMWRETSQWHLIKQNCVTYSCALFSRKRPPVQDVWGLSPMLGDSAAKLWEACEWLLADCPEATLENFMQYLYRQQLDESSSTTNY
jgi:hypothetical protein